MSDFQALSEEHVVRTSVSRRPSRLCNTRSESSFETTSRFKVSFRRGVPQLCKLKRKENVQLRSFKPKTMSPSKANGQSNASYQFSPAYKHCSRTLLYNRNRIEGCNTITAAPAHSETPTKLSGAVWATIKNDIASSNICREVRATRDFS